MTPITTVFHLPLQPGQWSDIFPTNPTSQSPPSIKHFGYYKNHMHSLFKEEGWLVDTQWVGTYKDFKYNTQFRALNTARR